MTSGAVDTDLQSKSALRLWLRLYRSVALIEREVRSRFSREFGVSLSRFDVLAALDRAENGLTMGELSAGLLVSNGNVTGLISRLVDDGLVVREASVEDRRSFRVQLTGPGRKAFADMAEAHENWLSDILGDMPIDTATALSANMDELMHYARLDNDASMGKD